MKLGVTLPQSDIGGDPFVIRDFAQAAEEIGYYHLGAADHVLGSNMADRPASAGRTFSSENLIHDVFVLFGYLAGQTTRLELSPQVLILPQRQTVLVAKQAASLDLLSGGRLRLGVGVGWNPVEYTVLNENFHDRGHRSEEQVTLMQALWREQHVKFQGIWHEIPDAGLNPLPVQRPIPVWFGGHSEQTLRRIGRWGNGWILLAYPPGEQVRQEIDKLRAYTRQAGRSETEIGLDAWMTIGGRKPDAWRKEVQAWRELGASHVTLTTTFNSFHHQRLEGRTLADHLAAIRHFYNTVADLL